MMFDKSLAILSCIVTCQIMSFCFLFTVNFYTIFLSSLNISTESLTPIIIPCVLTNHFYYNYITYNGNMFCFSTTDIFSYQDLSIFLDNFYWYDSINKIDYYPLIISIIMVAIFLVINAISFIRGTLVNLHIVLANIFPLAILITTYIMVPNYLSYMKYYISITQTYSTIIGYKYIINLCMICAIVSMICCFIMSCCYICFKRKNTTLP